MTASLLGIFLAVAVSAAESHEIWEGSLASEFVEHHRRGSRGDRWGHHADVTLRIIRKGNKFTGDWIEGDRVLEVAGTINGRRMQCRPTRAKQGKWPNEMVRNLYFIAEIKKDGMQGRMSGFGDGRSTSGSFELRKK